MIIINNKNKNVPKIIIVISYEDNELFVVVGTVHGKIEQLIFE